MKVNKWQVPTCDTDFGMAHILKKEILLQKDTNHWIARLLCYKDLDINKVVIHSYQEAGTSLEVVVELHTSCRFRPIKMGNILL